MVLALALLCFAPVRAEDVPLTQDGGVWKVPVRVNNAVTLQFVVDSGAAEVCVPQDVITTLMRAGTIHREDMLKDEMSILADGSRHHIHRVKLWQLEVGNQVLTDVPAMISPPSGVLLLGQSCLQRLPSWQLDTTRKVLHIGAVAAPSAPPSFHPKPRPTPTPEDAAPPDDATGWLWIGAAFLGVVAIALAIVVLRPARPASPRDPEDPGI
ncbi:MAG: retropepsin-like aspartic protease [Candidatus Xenobia bacterium]